MVPAATYPGEVPVLVYSLLRIALFGAVTALLWWAGMRSWLAPLLAAFLAWGLSYVLLARPRDAAALHLARRAEERRAGRAQGRAGDDAAAEDAADDALRGAQDAAAPRATDVEDPGTTTRRDPA